MVKPSQPWYRMRPGAGEVKSGLKGGEEEEGRGGRGRGGLEGEEEGREEKSTYIQKSFQVQDVVSVFGKLIKHKRPSLPTRVKFMVLEGLLASLLSRHCG